MAVEEVGGGAGGGRWRWREVEVGGGGGGGGEEDEEAMGEVGGRQADGPIAYDQIGRADKDGPPLSC